MSGWADRAALAWTRLYTHGLVAEAGERRREEMRSDLHEHQAYLGATRAQQLEVAGRLVRGLPADLSWRASQDRARHVSSSPPVVRRLTGGVLAILAAFEIWAGVGTLTADGAGPVYTVVLFAGAAMAGAGLVLRQTAPRRSTLLLVAAAAVPALVFRWMAPVFLPPFLLVSVLAVVTQPRRPLGRTLR